MKNYKINDAQPKPDEGITAVSKFNPKIIISIAFIIVSIIVIALIFIYGPSFFSNNEENNINSTDIVETKELANIATDNSTESDNANGQVINSEVENPPDINSMVTKDILDTDGDGVSDEEEIILGTDPSVLDTDRDGLYDGEEVKIFFTDPLKRDTDGDSYLDSVEVMNGFNPNGEGTLEQN
ncbi:MAG: hypothetical protein Q8Q23_01540 [bacterium]|nr:hypothetical protein [bacterium]